MLTDNIVHPAHYTQGSIETWDFIQDKGLNFDLGNVVKYVVRAGLKDADTELEDLLKARQYLEHEIKRVQVRLPSEKGEPDASPEA